MDGYDNDDQMCGDDDDGGKSNFHDIAFILYVFPPFLVALANPKMFYEYFCWLLLQVMSNRAT